MNRSKQTPMNPAGHVEITFTQTTSSMTFKGDPSVVQPMALTITRAQSVVHQQQLPPVQQLPAPPPTPSAGGTPTDDAASPAVAQTELDFTPTPPPAVVVAAPKATKKRSYAPAGQVDSLRAEDPNDGFKAFVGARTAESDTTRASSQPLGCATPER